MSYISIHFAAMTAILFFLYYCLPKCFQPYLLLLGSLYFYYRCSGILLLVMIFTSIIAYLFGIFINSKHKSILSKYIFSLCIVLIILPLILFKYKHFFFQSGQIYVGIPVGISFYTLQLISYCVDVYHDKYESETNFFSFLLFTSFFPQILQGPIPRYQELKKTLLVPHEYNRDDVTLGFSKILFGLLLKFMIADKAAVLVDTVFNSNEIMPGIAFAIAGIMYSFQLYADFLSCVSLAHGISLLFGVHLRENFIQPYCSVSIKEFWRRWHISLSTWLRDYIYIPLGGNRKGSMRTNINLLITFLVSGIWHGAGFKYIFWGLMHGTYQIIGKYTLAFRNHCFSTMKCPTRIRSIIQKLSTFILITIAWIIFRANSLSDGLYALYSIICRFDATSLLAHTTFHENELILGLSRPELFLLIVCIALLIYHDHRCSNGYCLDLLSGKSSFQQCLTAVVVLLIIAVFGTYGFGYDASTFIYGGF